MMISQATIRDISDHRSTHKTAWMEQQQLDEIVHNTGVKLVHYYFCKLIFPIQYLALSAFSEKVNSIRLDVIESNCEKKKINIQSTKLSHLLSENSKILETVAELKVFFLFHIVASHSLVRFEFVFLIDMPLNSWVGKTNASWKLK